MERAIEALPVKTSSGLVVVPNIFMTGHRELIVSVAARHRVVAVHPFRFFAAVGGLIAYGFDSIDMHARAASYVDRILKGEIPGDLPVQLATKFELVLNLATAKTLGGYHAADAARARRRGDRV